MAASMSSVQSPANAKIETTPGAYPASPAPAEMPTIVSSQLSLSQAVHARRAEYTKPLKIKVKVGTWNVASLKGTEKDIGGWFVDGKGVSESLSGLAIGDENAPETVGFHTAVQTESVEAQENRQSKKASTLPKNDPGALPGGDEIGIYVLGLQEIVDVNSLSEALRPYTDPHPAEKWKQALAKALPKGYSCVAEQRLIGLLLVVYASAALSPTISSVSTTSVGTGIGGYMGNKGAVTARIVLGEATRMVFVNCHLHAGVERGSLDKRNGDASQVQMRTKFEPIYDGGGAMEEFSEGIGDEEFAFWFGDLNYRLEGMPGEDVRRLLMLHTKDEYGKDVASKQKIEHELANPESSTFAGNQEAALSTLDNERSSTDSAVAVSPHHSTASSVTLPNADKPDPSSDPTSLHTTLSSLLVHDQLHSQMRTRKAFHDGWREGPIDFLPTYKYDVGSVGMFDSSEKRRGPSWCDRILFRSRKGRLDYEERVQAEEQAKKKDNEMKLRGVVEEAANEAVLFDYDPETDGADNETDQSANFSKDSDVVMTKAGFEDRLELDSYTSHQRVLSSDHKPLDAVFTLDYDAVDPDLKAKIHQEVARELDKAENEGRPVVTIVVDHHRDSDASYSRNDPAPQNYEGVNFGDVKYDHQKTRNITIANTGRVPATLGFVDRSVDTGQPGGFPPPWLTIDFDRPSDNKNPNPGALQEYTLEPGDAATVTMNLHVTDLEHIRRLNEHDEKLEDVLVLRIHNGRDYFLPIRGNWMQSAFGRSIEKLVRIPEGGVRRWQHQRPDGSSQGDHDGVKWSAPRELFRLTEAIEELTERAIAEWSMTAEDGEAPWMKDRGWPFRGWTFPGKDTTIAKEMIREGLDTDTSFARLFTPELGSTQRLEALAETLLEFLKSLEDGVVPDSLWQELESRILETEKAKRALADEEKRMAILDIVSSAPAHSVSFTFITFMLSRIANEIAPIPRTLKRQGTATSFNEMDAVKESNGDPAKQRRKEVDEAYAAIFADAMIRWQPLSTGKVTKASEVRRKHIVEIFLQSGLGDNV